MEVKIGTLRIFRCMERYSFEQGTERNSNPLKRKQNTEDPKKMTTAQYTRLSLFFLNGIVAEYNIFESIDTNIFYTEFLHK
jgi:hypothetical protein